MTSTAVISPCGQYRYALSRVWNPERGLVNWVMLNPSTADASQDDPTIRRCIGYAEAWGFGGIMVTNLFAYRAKDREEIRYAMRPVGPDNDSHIWTVAKQASKIVAGWGADGGFQDRDKKVLYLLSSFDIQCLGRTKDGHPKHPLYLRADEKPIPLRIAA